MKNSLFIFAILFIVFYAFVYLRERNLEKKISQIVIGETDVLEIKDVWGEAYTVVEENVTSPDIEFSNYRMSTSPSFKSICENEIILFIYRGNSIPFIERFEDQIYLYFNQNQKVCYVRRISL